MRPFMHTINELYQNELSLIEMFELTGDLGCSGRLDSGPYGYQYSIFDHLGKLKYFSVHTDAYFAMHKALRQLLAMENV